MRLLANAIATLHVAWVLVMATGWLYLPWYVLALMSAAVAMMNGLNGWRCPVTRLEYYLRRRATRRFMPYTDAFLPYYKELDPLPFHVVGRGERGLYVTDHIEGRSLIGRMVGATGLRLSERQVNAVTIAVLAGSPILALWR